MPESKKRLSSPFIDQLVSLFILLLLLLPFLLPTPKPLQKKVEPSPQVKDVKKESLGISQVNAQAVNEDYCLTVPVILYHHIQPLYLAAEKKQESLSVGVEYFDMQMKYLADSGYVTLSATQLVKALLNREELPAKSIVVTFDDGYEDNYLYAYPILRKYGIIGNFMISTSLVDTQDYMTWTQLAEMAESNLVEIYNHTAHHVDIGNASKEEALDELVLAKDTLEKKLGITSPIFTYPYGSVSESAREALKFTGYVAAFTTQHGFLQCRSQLLDLHRDHVGNAPLTSYGL